MTLHQFPIGVDVSKATLDIFDSQTSRYFQIDNHTDAITAWLDGLDTQRLVVFEATSRVDQTLHTELERRQGAFVRVNPRDARDFAKASGRRTKTDRVDAAMLAHMAQALKPAPSQPRSTERVRLSLYLSRRRQMVEMRKQERTRRHQFCNDPWICQSLDHMLSILDQQIRSIEAVIRELIEANSDFRKASVCLQSAPGIGPVTAATLIADLPELGHRNRKQIASLTGLAPHPRDSGTFRGKRTIWGGRRHIRHLLFAAAVTASRSKADVKDRYQALTSRGKQKKCPLIAIARWMITALNAMIAKNSNWHTKEMAQIT
ncbi:MAG: transposase [Asticcacaulis sp.]|nr:transposase [Asticcacaulis sp.]